MEEKILKSFIIALSFFLITSCNDKNDNKEIEKINKAISLIKNTEAINDTLIKYHSNLGVEFIPCYVRQTKKHNILTFQIVQSRKEKSPPIKIDRVYRIEKIRNIDVFLSTNILDTTKTFVPEIDRKTEELINKGYLTIKDKIYLNDSYFVSFVFCKENDDKFKIINLDFLATEELKARNQNKPFFEENLYPKCY